MRSGESAQNRVLQIPEKPIVPDSMAHAEQLMREQMYETLYLFGKDEVFIDGSNGTRTSAAVEVSLDLVKDAICIHNHPVGNTFSPGDIQFIRDLNPSDFRVVTKQKRYRIIRPDDGWPTNLMTIYRKYYVTYFNRNDKERKRGKTSEAEFTKRVFKSAIEKTAQYLELGYTEEEL